MSQQSLEIGTTTVRKLELPICTLCGYVIDEFDGCAYDCTNDDLPIDERDHKTILVRVWERTDKLIEQRPYE